MARDEDTGVQLRDFGFQSSVRMLGDVSELDLDEIRRDIGSKIDNFTDRGSGYTLLCITSFTVCTARYNPLT